MEHSTALRCLNFEFFQPFPLKGERKLRKGSGYINLLETFVIGSGNDIIGVEGETIISS